MLARQREILRETRRVFLLLVVICAWSHRAEGFQNCLWNARIIQPRQVISSRTAQAPSLIVSGCQLSILLDRWNSAGLSDSIESYQRRRIPRSRKTLGNLLRMDAGAGAEVRIIEPLTTNTIPLGQDQTIYFIAYSVERPRTMLKIVSYSEQQPTFPQRRAHGATSSTRSGSSLAPTPSSVPRFLSSPSTFSPPGLQVVCPPRHPTETKANAFNNDSFG